jgi:hypothetical protein
LSLRRPYRAAYAPASPERRPSRSPNANELAADATAALIIIYRAV